MRRFLTNCLCLMLAAAAPAFSADEGDVVRELGSVLGWRLAPGLVESRCRDVDPEGADARKKALDAWLAKNADQIKAVDASVDEVLQLLVPNKPLEETRQGFRKQVETILAESVLPNSNAADLKAACKLEADPARRRWNNHGKPEVQEGLAALYDWKVARERASAQ